jgi:aconitate hydratase
MFGIPKKGDIDYTTEISLDLSTVSPSLAGPKRPQDRIEIGNVKSTFADLFSKPTSEKTASTKKLKIWKKNTPLPMASKSRTVMF